MSPPPMSVPTTEPAFTDWQSTIPRSLPPPKMLKQISKATTNILTNHQTRLHSSRMCTAHVLTISPSMLCGGGVSALGGVCSRGCLLWGVSAPRGCLLWGECLLPGVSARGGLLLGGAYFGVCVSQHALRQTPPPPSGQNS